MSEQPRTRQELYDRIRQSSKQEFILEEMIRLGFWATAEQIATDPTNELRRQGEIARELTQLRQENARLGNEKKLRQELLKQRLAQSKRKQQETKERREKERVEKAQKWLEQKQTGISYLGAEVSGGLNNTEGNRERLSSYGLPLWQNAGQVAAAMGISVGQLRFLAFSRKTSTICHYIRFNIPKKTGGSRSISAPMPKLKEAQRWILVRFC